MPVPDKHHRTLWKEIALTLLAILSVGLLVYEFSAELAAHEIKWLYRVDVAIALIFLADFLAGMYLSKNRRRYWRHNWYLLLASIPISEGIFQALRALRILRIVRILRVLTRIKKMAFLADVVSENGSRVIYIVSVVAITIFSGAAAIFTVEADANPEISNFFDAIWWAAVTATTVGYGDIYPVTWEGRLIAIFLMFFGIGLVGTVAGMVGGSILKDSSKK